MRISGRVRCANRFVSDALVVAEASSVGSPEISAMTNANGEFVLNLPLGEFTLIVHSRDGSCDPLSIVVGGEMEVELEIS